VAFSYPTSPEVTRLDIDTLRRVSNVVRSIMTGKTNNTGSVTLTASATSTVVSDINVGGDSVILLSPLTANAAAAIGTTYISSVGDQTFTITHANNAQTDKDFSYVVVG
jgi:hypothetical protein